MATLLIADHDNASLSDQTAKAMTAAVEIGGDVHVLVAGKGCDAAAQEAAKLSGVAKVLVADADHYEHQLAEP
ncbi:MAG: electron transfer flavoprotein subunit alpha/FixB family protein, partial [Pseudomonadota bacterium]